MKKLFHYFKDYKKRFIIGSTMKIISTILELFIPYLLSYILDDIIPEVSDTKDIKPVIYYGVLMIVVSIVVFITNVKANQMAARLSAIITEKERNNLFDKINHLSARQVDEVTIPSLISRASTDTYNLYQSLNIIQRLGLRAPILFTGGIIMCAIMDARLTLIFLAVLPFVALFIFLITKKGLPIFNKIQLAMDSLVQSVQECITGIRVIKSLAKEEDEKSRFQKVNKQVYEFEFSSAILMASLQPVIDILLNIGLIGVLLFGAYQVNNGETQVGKIIAFISYFTLISTSMMALSRIFQNVSRGIASVERIHYLLSLPRDLAQEAQKDFSPYFIEMRNVTFAYKTSPILKNINFHIKENESLGIIGSTGSGKSTILHLLMRFYDSNEGAIYVNYQDVRTYPMEDLKLMFGTVFQNDTLFQDTIYENVSFGRNLSNKDVKTCLKKAQAYDFVSKNKDGIYAMVAAKGNNLSGGQKQRLLIARAIANHPPILILDDATSALDYKTDAYFREELRKMHDVTKIIVSARISSLKDCDHIIVLDQGEIVAYGTHEELLLNSKNYQEIAQSQMGGDFDA